jgi:hypothetical protein
MVGVVQGEVSHHHHPLHSVDMLTHVLKDMRITEKERGESF